MNKRRGEKIGWIGGWLGSFLWLLILSVVWMVTGRWAAGLAGLVLFGIAVSLIFALVPWRWPETKYWKLLVPEFLLLIGCAVFAVVIYGGMEAAGIDWWALVLLVPILTTFPNLGRRRWVDGEAAAAGDGPRTDGKDGPA